MRARFLWMAGAGFVAALSFGCSANVGAAPESTDADATSQTSAIVVVERVVGANGETARSEAAARFVRVRGRGVSDEALRIAGATLDLPPLGSCTSVTGLTAANMGSVRSLQLLDVGQVSLEANGVPTTLTARRLPDVADVVSGVVYARGAEGDLLASRAPYVLRVAGTGEGDVGAFSMAFSPPAELGDFHVAGQEARGTVTLAAGSAIDLSWEPGASEDTIYVDIASREFHPTLRCAFGDNGHAAIPATAIQHLDEGTITLHRVHRESFRAKGVDLGEVRFDFAKVAGVVRR